MARETLHLPKAGERKMTPEEWWTNKDCNTAKRDHKWRWLVDITSGQASMDQAICVHCGATATLTMDKIHVTPR